MIFLKTSNQHTISKECVWNVHVDTKDADYEKLKTRELLALYLLGSISTDRICQLLKISRGQLQGLMEQFHELIDEYTEV